mgnify:CR=1 FL=1
MDVREGNVPAFQRWCAVIFAKNKAYVKEITFETYLAQTSDGEKVILGRAKMIMKSDEDMINEVFELQSNVPHSVVEMPTEA